MIGVSFNVNLTITIDNIISENFGLMCVYDALNNMGYHVEINDVQIEETYEID